MTQAPRLALITPEGMAVYEGRKMLAHLRTDYRWSPGEIEEARTEDFTHEPPEHRVAELAAAQAAEPAVPEAP